MICRSTHNPITPRAFTLIELICVVLVLAVTAGIIAPRISTSDARAMETKADTYAHLFSYIAKRDALSGEPMRLEFDRELDTLELLVLRRHSLETSLNRANWQPDPLAPSVDLTQVVPETLYLDGTPTVPERWSIEFPQSEVRPSIALALKGESASGRTRVWYVELLPYETKATIRDGTTLRDPLRNRAVDLDAIGRGETVW